MKNKYRGLALITTVIIILIGIWNSRHAQAYIAGKPGSFKLVPQSDSLPYNQTRNFEVKFNTGGQAISALQFRLSYANPNNELEVVSLTESNALRTNNFTPQIMKKETINNITNIDVAFLKRDETSYSNTVDTTLITIAWKANYAFTAKNVNFDTSLTQMYTKVGALDIAGSVTNGIYSTTGTFPPLDCTQFATNETCSPNMPTCTWYTCANNGTGGCRNTLPVTQVCPCANLTTQTACNTNAANCSWTTCNNVTGCMPIDSCANPSPTLEPSSSPNPTVSPNPSPTVPPGETGVQFKLNLEAITSQKPDLTFRIKAVNESNNQSQVFTQTGQSDTQGYYTTTMISSLPAGTYSFIVFAPGRLSKKFTGQTVQIGANIFNYTNTPLLAGNCTESADISAMTQKIDIFDYNIIVQHFGSRMPASGSPADFNLNNGVDIYDYGALVGNFDLQGDL